MKTAFSFLLAIALVSTNAHAADSTVCGILTTESPGAALSIRYFLSYGTSPDDQWKVELTAANNSVQKFLSKSFNNSAICVTGTLEADQLTVEEIKPQDLAL